LLFKGYGAKVGLGNMRVKAENRMVTIKYYLNKLFEWLGNNTTIPY